MTGKQLHHALRKTLVQLPIIFTVLVMGTTAYNLMGTQETPIGVAARALLLLGTAAITSLLTANLISWVVEGASLRDALRREPLEANEAATEKVEEAA